MMKKGLFYWTYSLNHPEDFPDIYYVHDVIIIDPEKDKDFLKKVSALRDLITTYCCLKDNLIEGTINEVIYKIKDILVNIDNINYTEFVAYWKSLDAQYGTFLELPNQEDLLKKLLDKYCERRRVLYEKYGYTNVSIQALYDSGSSRSKGQKFKRKIKDKVEEVLGEDANLIFIEKKNWKKIKKDLKLKYNFGKHHQNKIPDFLITYNDHFIIGEAKHIHNTGGAQDKQISELIDFINQSEEQINIHYLAFLDGLYMYRFIKNDLSDKLKKQKNDIESALKKYPQNFFVNTNGLLRLLEDLRNEYKD